MNFALRRVRLDHRIVRQIGFDQYTYGAQHSSLLPGPCRVLLDFNRCISLRTKPRPPRPFRDSHLQTQKRFKNRFVPRKAAVKITDKARKFFKKLLENPPRPDVVGILLSHQQSGTGEPRMVFTFRFAAESDIDRSLDEGVSLELVDQIDSSTGQVVKVPKPPSESQNDTLPKLYVHHDAFLKVLGSTVDVDIDSLALILYDREGNVMDPNA